MKFAVGDKALVYCADFDPPCYQPAWCIGQCVEIIAAAESDMNWADYIVRFDNGHESMWDENTLRPIPPAIAPATLALFTKKQPNPDKVKETIP